MRVFMTGGSGVLGTAVMPLLRRAGHEVEAPGRRELDLFDPTSVGAHINSAEAVLHLATRIPPRESQGNPAAWRENDRLRAVGTRVLVDAALAARVGRFVFPSIAFVYPPSGRVDETTPVAAAVPDVARSALEAERQVERFARDGGRGVVLRLGLLYGPGTGSDTPAERYAAYGATLRIEDAGSALALALDIPSGIYDVVRDGERVSNERFKETAGWRPRY
jgi:nucleoside-diphosphate-sugar epimerase